MLLAIDIGNTATKLGVFDGQELRASWRWATDSARLADEYAAQLGWLLEHSEYNQLAQSDDLLPTPDASWRSVRLPRQGREGRISLPAIRRTVLSSVVPQLTATFEQLSQHYLGCEPLRVSATINTGVRLVVENPTEVGADRIANAVAAKTLYQAPAIIVDFGTTTNFDVVSGDGDFVGACFAPGLQSSVDGLLARAARLQRFELIAPPRVIGTNTVMCLQAGTIYGHVGLVEGLVARIERELGQRALVIGTGGFVETIARETPVIQVVDPHLTLHGLRVLADLNPTKGES